MQVVFKHYLESQWDNGSVAFELKRTTTNRLPIKNVAPHQVRALLQAYEGTYYYKIPDDSIGAKPFDCFVLQQSLAYIVIGFGEKLKDFVLVPIYTWIQQTKKKKSVTREEVVRWEDVEVIPIPSRRS